ncbi:MAG: TonB-dependent receptor, partial [Saprospiraceae bacterium]
MKKITLLLSLLFVVGGTLLAQRTVTGSVTDTEGTPLIGASLLVEGTSSGTVTDFDGNFTINNVPATATALIVSYTGYATSEVDIPDDNKIDIVLEDNAIGLTEIVVSGQGVGIERKRLTTTVDVITSEQLELAPITQLDQVLQSRLPGAQIRLSSGQPGTASIIRNRGPITANGSSTPVIIIDGVRVDNLNSNPTLGLNTGGASSSALADIPIESIERVEFIRGGAATTLYGADAANGVLQIFTKKGTSGSARLTGGAIVGAMVGEEKFLKFEETADVLFEPGLVQQYRVGVDGGSDVATYNFSGSFYDDDGFNDLNEQRRISARFGTHANIGKNISYDGSASFTSNYFTRDYNANTSFSRFSNLESGDFGDLTTISGAGLDSIRTDLFEQGSLTDITEAIRRFQTSQQITYKPFEGFTSRLIVGLDSRRSRQEEIATNALYISKGLVAPGTSNRGTIDRSTRDFIALTADLALGYEVSLGNDFSFNTQVGTQLFRNQDEQLLLQGSNLIEGSVSLNNTAEITTQDFFQAITFGGFYVAENIGFKDKLFLDLGLRWDFNSAFGESIGLVNLKRIGLRYSLTDESFMQEGRIADILTRFSIRANYGEASNFPTPFARDQVFNSIPLFGFPAYT